MSSLNFRDYNLELELSIPESIPCTKRDVWFPITKLDLPTFEVTTDKVGLFPNTSFGREISKYVEDGYKPNPYDYYSVPRVIKNGVYEIHCSMFIKTENDKEIKKCLETWLQKIFDNIYVPSVIKGYSKDTGELMLEKIKCTKTFISQLREDSMCGEKYIDFTFICDEMIEDKE